MNLMMTPDFHAKSTSVWRDLLYMFDPTKISCAARGCGIYFMKAASGILPNCNSLLARSLDDWCQRRALSSRPWGEDNNQRVTKVGALCLRCAQSRTVAPPATAPRERNLMGCSDVSEMFHQRTSHIKRSSQDAVQLLAAPICHALPLPPFFFLLLSQKSRMLKRLC